MKEPKIRFKEFEGEWEETTFGKISSNYKYGINAAAIPFDGTNKYLRITDIDEESRMFSKQDLTSPNADLSLCDDYLLEDGDITIARTGASVGKSYIYHKRDGKVYFAGFLIRMRLNKCTDKDCVYNITLTDKYSKHIRLVSQRSGQPGVNINELKDFSFFLPIDIPEQQSIASFFTTIDAQISASTSRLASLKQIKAASLQAMFPQEGETVPKLRFKGFDGEWERKRLNQFLIPSSTKNTDGKYNKKDVLSVSGEFGIVNQITFQGRSFAGVSVANYGVVEHDNIVYTKSPLKTNPYGIIKVNKGKAGIVSTLYAVYNCLEGTYPCFVEYYFGLDNRLNSYLRPLVRKGAKNDMKISSNDALLGEVVFPSFAEQRAIASYFTNLDRQITLQTQRLEKLKQIKAACLDNMFV